MTELPANVDLQWVGRMLLAIQAEQGAIKDEIVVLGARAGRAKAGIEVILAEMRALRNQVTRMNDRVEALEARP